MAKDSINDLALKFYTRGRKDERESFRNNLISELHNVCGLPLNSKTILVIKEFMKIEENEK